METETNSSYRLIHFIRTPVRGLWFMAPVVTRLVHYQVDKESGCVLLVVEKVTGTQQVTTVPLNLKKAPRDLVFRLKGCFLNISALVFSLLLCALFGYPFGVVFLTTAAGLLAGAAVALQVAGDIPSGKALLFWLVSVGLLVLGCFCCGWDMGTGLVPFIAANIAGWSASLLLGDSVYTDGFLFYRVIRVERHTEG